MFFCFTSISIIIGFFHGSKRHYNGESSGQNSMDNCAPDVPEILAGFNFCYENIIEDDNDVRIPQACQMDKFSGVIETL